MFRKLRRAAAILCGTALVSVAVLSSCSSAVTTDPESLDITAESDGKSGSQIHKEESGSSDDSDSDRSSEHAESPETLTDDTAAAGESTGESASGETETAASGEDTTEEPAGETSGEDVTEETVSETEEETSEKPAEDTTEETEEETEQETTTEAETEEPEPMVGLRKFFDHKLVVDSKKTALYLNIRAEPNDESPILGILYPNDIATYIRKTGNWYEIEREGFTGYVNASYVFTDKKAYDIMYHTVAYAAMVQNYESYLYAVPDATTEIVLCAHKSDAFRLKGISGGFYEVEVVSELYETLFMPMDDAIVFYLFLGQGNDNELGEHEEEFFGTLEVEQNLERSEELIEEYAQDLQEYKDYLASSEAASREVEQAYIAASRKAAQDAAEAARQQVSSAAEQAHQSGEAQYLGKFYITHYCHCQKCCGVWGSNDPNYQAHGASGMMLQEDYTVAVNLSQIPYGTRLSINGKEYIAADIGVGPNQIDIYRRTHEAALAGGAYYADVYLLP